MNHQLTKTSDHLSNLSTIHNVGVISTINHSFGSYVHQLRELWAPLHQRLMFKTCGFSHVPWRAEPQDKAQATPEAFARAGRFHRREHGLHR